MLMEYDKRCCYNLIEETKIETDCGEIYQGQDLELQRTVAVKCIRIPDKVMLQKALAEVRALVRLGEENISIPHIYDAQYLEKSNQLMIVMEWIKGTTLETKMNAPELSFLQWMIELCDILNVMERKHIYHKDVKPSNIMIAEKDKLYLIDFNISIATPNLVEGTLNYKAPEMSLDSKYQGREKVDMFSIGVILYKYYTGQVPVKGIDYARKRTRGPLEWDKYIQPIEKNSGMNPEINQVISKCMKLDPKQRYRNYLDLKNDIIKVVKNIRWAQKKKN